MHDDLIVWQNIIAMTACTVLAATYLPLALRLLKWGHLKLSAIFTKQTVSSLYMPEIVVLALGLVLTALGTFSVRGYSFVLREYDMIFLRSTALAPVAIGLQALGAVVAAAAYYVNPEHRKLTAEHTRGVWTGMAMFAALISLKFAF